VADLAGQMLAYGTRKHDRLAFQKALDDIAADEQAGSEFSLQVLSSQFRAGMALLAENELQPAFPAGAYAVVQREAEQSLAGTLVSPEYLFGRAAEKAIVPAGDAALREATPQTVAATSLADMKAYYGRAFRPDLTTIVVVGDVTAADARQVVMQDFGGWTGVGPTPAIDLPAIPPSHASSAQVPDSSSVQDSVVLTESVPMSVSDPDRYTLMLGNTILGGGFSSLLYDDLRVRGGYVYSVESSLDWTRTRCTYSVSFGADPDKVSAAAALAVRDLARMQTAPVSEAALIRAKAQTLRRLPMQRASVEGLARLYLRLVDLGLPLDTPQVAARHYFDTTAAGVQAAYAKWLRPGDLARVVKGPAVTQ
jgi:zinc protease